MALAALYSFLEAKAARAMAGKRGSVLRMTCCSTSCIVLCLHLAQFCRNVRGRALCPARAVEPGNERVDDGHQVSDQVLLIILGIILGQVHHVNSAPLHL